jgi:hypothetical protein
VSEAFNLRDNDNERQRVRGYKTHWTVPLFVKFFLQAVGKKLGKEEDEHIVASDSQLDAKLELFK